MKEDRVEEFLRYKGWKVCEGYWILCYNAKLYSRAAQVYIYIHSGI